MTELSGELEVYDEILSKQKYLLENVSHFLLPADTWHPINKIRKLDFVDFYHPPVGSHLGK